MGRFLGRTLGLEKGKAKEKQEGEKKEEEIIIDQPVFMIFPL